MQPAAPSRRWLSRQRICSRRALKRLAVLFAFIFAVLVWAYFTMIRMPGRSFSGPLPSLTQSQAALAEEMRRDVRTLAGDIGKRNVLFSTGLNRAVDAIEQSLREAGYADVRRQTFKSMGIDVHNIEVEIRGTSRPEEIIVIGAHYDSVDDSPAANDNASGVAATLALSRRFAAGPAVPADSATNSQTDHGSGDDGGALAGTAGPTARTIRFVLFVNEEPPHFQTDEMGSLVYARACRHRGDDIVAMLSLETIGNYSDEPGSQRYPAAPIGWVYPSTGDFIGFVGNYSSRALVRQSIGVFRASTQFPSEGAALPGSIAGIGWSDHWAFWQCGYPAIMLTDSALFRSEHYHQLSDTPEKLDYDRMARVVEGIESVIRSLSGGDANKVQTSP